MRPLTLATTAALTLLAASAPISSASAQAPTASGPRKLAPLPPALPRTHTPKPTKPAITAEDLKTRVYIFADDSMLGREAGTLGNYKGTEYIASELKRFGLQPAGDSGTYFQAIPMVSRTVKSNAAFTVNGQSLTLWNDYAPVPGLYGPAPGELRDTALTIIFAGRAGEPYKLSPEQTSGKLVIFLPPTEEALKADPRITRLYPPRADNGAALGYVALDRFSPERREAIKYSTPIYNPQNRQLSKPVGKPVIYFSSAGLEKIFGKPVDQLTPGDTVAAASVLYEFEVSGPQYPARNVVAILPGSDPKLRNTYVALGSHNDHEGVGQGAVDHDSLKAFNQIARIGGAEGPPRMLTAEETAELNATIAALRQKNPPRQDSIFNGADDDASGSMTMLEIAEYFASLKGKARPKRSILFVWHTAEEKGLWGSEWFTEHPTVPRDSIVTQLNIDMVGRGEASDNLDGHPDFLQLVGSRRLSTQLGDIVEEINTKKKHNFKLDYSLDANGHPQNIYCRSDHYNYARWGIPVTFFMTGVHPDYHQVTDEPQYINYDHMSRIASFIANVALEIANRAERPVVDKPKPNPYGQCRQ